MMGKFVFRYFFDFYDAQKNWLNKKAEQGYRLARTSTGGYYFDKCEPEEYVYDIELVGNMSEKERGKYRDLLDDAGYKVHVKGINISYMQYGKVKFRPWDSHSKFATSRTRKRELFIVEKKNDGTPFELHTETSDLVQQFTVIRNLFLNLTLMLSFFVLFGFFMGVPALGLIALAFLVGFPFPLVIKYTLRIKKLIQRNNGF